MSHPRATNVTDLLTLEQARAAVAAFVTPIAEAETLLLAQADGRVLAAALIAPSDLPPFDNSAVDGFAFAHADLAAGPLPVLGRVAAGAPAAPLAAGTATRIFTGAAIPHGADTIAMQEDVALHDGRARFPQNLARGANLRRRGEDVSRGTLALPAGRRLRPQDLALAAALGLDALTVVRRPRVALFSTGDEILEPGTPPGPAQRPDSNRVMLQTLLARAGAAVTDLGILPDWPEAIDAALAGAEASHDLVLTSGGVSVGEEDHVKAAVARRGSVALWRLAIKPGRPLAFGRVGGALFAGLPGNPVSAFVTFSCVVRPLLAGLTGEKLAPFGHTAVAGFSHCKRKGLREFVRVTLRDEGGVSHADRLSDGAANLSSLTETHGLADLPEDVERVAPGDVVTVLPYEGMF